ncbi:BolA family protein [Xylella fastidiosa subsp. sandyi]|nr:BolA family protein [Xylella fastidiosa]
MNRVERIQIALGDAFAPSRLEVKDESDRHIGHSGARDGRGHFSVLIVTPMFAGKTLLARHRAVYAALGSMMKTDIHALSIQALVDEGEGQSTIVVGAVQNV